jgi:chromosome segregation ATPase
LGQIYNWLKANLKSFRRPVWGPIACEVTLKTNNAAAYLEQHVPNFALKAFVVEDRRDYDLLYKKIRQEKGWPINIILVNKGELKSVEREYTDAMYRVLKKEHGVCGYLDEAFTAPDPVMQALRDIAAVHKVLVGSEKTQKSIDDHGLLDLLTEPKERGGRLRGSCIFSSKGRMSFKYTTLISRYNGQPSKRQDDVEPAKMLAAGVDPAVKQRVQNELEEAQDELAQLDKRLQEAKAAADEVMQVAQLAKADFDQAKKVVAYAKKLADKIRGAKEKLARLQEELDNMETDGNERTLIQRFKKRIEVAITALEESAKSHKETMETTFASAGTMMMLDEYQSAERRVR